MLIVFIGEGIALLGLVIFGHNPIAFLIFTPAIFLFWGEIYAISSALAGDTFGSKYVTATSGALFSSKGVAALCVPLGSLVAATAGGWTTVFVICAAVSIATALFSKLVLAPMRAKFIQRTNAMISGVVFGNAVSGTRIRAHCNLGKPQESTMIEGRSQFIKKFTSSPPMKLLKILHRPTRSHWSWHAL